MKKPKLLKKMIALFMVLAIDINSFGAVITDNDGTAFVSKAEVDALRNSFQSKINQYNSSIDARIEGAIAEYLAGIKNITKYEAKTFGYVAEGIYNVTGANEAFKWREGTLGFNVVIGAMRNFLDGNDIYLNMNSNNIEDIFELKPTNSVTGVFSFNLNTTVEPYSFCAVKNVDYNSSIGTACWDGYVTETHALNGISIEHGGQGKGMVIETRTLRPGYGFIPQLKKNLFDGGKEQIAKFSFYDNSSTENNTANGNFDTYSNGMSVTRIRSNKKAARIIATGLKSTPPDFIDSDYVCDWCYDDSTSSNKHIRWNTLNEVFDNAKLTIEGGSSNPSIRYVSCWYLSDGNKQNNNTLGLSLNSRYCTKYINPKKNWSYPGTSMNDSSRKYCFYKPFIGFRKNLTSWSNIWVDYFDSLINSIEDSAEPDIIKTYTGINPVVNKQTDYGKHLNVENGYPIIFASSGDTVEFDISFLQQDALGNTDNNDHDLFLKIGPFNQTDNVDKIDSSDIFKGCFHSRYDNGTTKTIGKILSNQEKGGLANSILIPAGKTEKIEIRMPVSGYIFAKWCNSGDKTYKGGVLSLAKRYTVYTTH